MTLEGDSSALKQRTARSLGLWIAIEDVQPEVDVWLDLEVILTESHEI